MKFGQWLGLIAFVVSLYIIWEIRQLLLLLFVAVVFATALNRLVRQAQRLGMQRGVAAAISVFGVLAVLALFAALIVPPFLDQFQQLTRLVPEGFQQLEAWLQQLVTRLPGGADDLIPSLNDLTNQIQPLASGLANNVFRLFSGFINLTGGVLFVVIFTVMLLLNPPAYRQGFIQLIPAFYRRRMDEILTLCEADLVNWIIGTLFNMVVIGVVSGIALWILGIRLVLANALLAGLMEAIPNLGPFLSTIAPASIALLDSPLKAVGVVVVYFLIQQLEQFLLVPIVMGQQVSLLPAITLLAQIVFASFFGFLGLFLAIPLVIIVRILIQEIVVRDVLDHWLISPFPGEAAAGAIVSSPLSSSPHSRDEDHAVVIDKTDRTDTDISPVSSLPSESPANTPSPSETEDLS